MKSYNIQIKKGLSKMLISSIIMKKCCKRIIVMAVLFMTLANSKLYSQYKIGESVNYQLGVSFGAGAEFGIAGVFPKISLNRFQRHTQFETYSGLEFTPWIWGAYIVSSDLLLGIKYKFFTLDSSIGGLYYFNVEESGNYKQATLNPKFGVKFGQVWVKFGPSFLFYKNYDPNPPQVLQPFKIDGRNFNIDIMIMQKI
jgi:hypothetical protein